MPVTSVKSRVVFAADSPGIATTRHLENCRQVFLGEPRERFAACLAKTICKTNLKTNSKIILTTNFRRAAVEASNALRLLASRFTSIFPINLKAYVHMVSLSVVAFPMSVAPSRQHRRDRNGRDDLNSLTGSFTMSTFKTIAFATLIAGLMSTQAFALSVGSGNGNGNGNVGVGNGNGNGNSNTGFFNGNGNGNGNWGIGNGNVNGNGNVGAGSGNLNGNLNRGIGNGNVNGNANAGILNGNLNGNGNWGFFNGNGNGNGN
jgi:hypothetical protein